MRVTYGESERDVGLDGATLRHCAAGGNKGRHGEESDCGNPFHGYSPSRTPSSENVFWTPCSGAPTDLPAASIWTLVAACYARIYRTRRAKEIQARERIHVAASFLYLQWDTGQRQQSAI